MKLSKIKGFTLIEILLVVSILSIILVVVFAALNPAQRLAEAQDARRWNDVNQLLTAIHECILDNDGTLSSCDLTDDNTAREIVNTGISTSCNAAPCDTEVAATGNCADLETELVTTQNYMASLPLDPSGPATDHTGYVVNVNNGLVTVSSCTLDVDGNVISVSR